MTKFLCGECIHNSDKGGACLIPKNLGYVDNCNHYLPKDRPIVQTNEEWLHTLNTEQLAEWLVEVTQYCYECGTDVHNCECCPFGKCIDKGFAMEWLKQPHKE